MAAEITEIAREQTAMKDGTGFVASRTWQVKLDSHIFAAYSSVIAVAANEADIGDRFPLNNFLFLKTLTPSPTESRDIWNVRADYEQTSAPFGRIENPLELPAKVSWSSEAYTAPVVSAFDESGDKTIPIVNSAGQPFDPPLTEPRRTLVGTVTYNSETFNPIEAEQFQESVNDAPAIIGNITVLERMAKIIEFVGEEQEFEGIDFFAVTIKVQLNTNQTIKKVEGGDDIVVAQGWDREVLDQGLFELTTADPPKLVRMSTDDGEQVTEPIKLNGEGKKLDPQTADPIFLAFKTNRQKDFSGLRLEVTAPKRLRFSF